jgi:hypothetical protein
MAVKRTLYSRNFTSQTEKEDVSMHGSLEWKDYQEINEEDKKIRLKIKEKFGFHSNDENGGEGFDGEILYDYLIADNLCTLEESSQNVEYQTKVAIKKAGYENELPFWSDLEKFLIKNSFKQLE